MKPTTKQREALIAAQRRGAALAVYGSLGKTHTMTGKPPTPVTKPDKGLGHGRDGKNGKNGHWPFDFTLDVRRECRRREAKRQVAWLAVTLSAVWLGVAAVALIERVSQGWFSGLAANVLIAGFWGGWWLVNNRK